MVDTEWLQFDPVLQEKERTCEFLDYLLHPSAGSANRRGGFFRGSPTTSDTDNATASGNVSPSKRPFASEDSKRKTSPLVNGVRSYSLLSPSALQVSPSAHSVSVHPEQYEGTATMLPADHHQAGAMYPAEWQSTPEAVKIDHWPLPALVPRPQYTLDLSQNIQITASKIPHVPCVGYAGTIGDTVLRVESRDDNSHLWTLCIPERQFAAMELVRTSSIAVLGVTTDIPPQVFLWRADTGRPLASEVCLASGAPISQVVVEDDYVCFVTASGSAEIVKVLPSGTMKLVAKADLGPLLVARTNDVVSPWPTNTRQSRPSSVREEARPYGFVKVFVVRQHLVALLRTGTLFLNRNDRWHRIDDLLFVRRSALSSHEPSLYKQLPRLLDPSTRDHFPLQRLQEESRLLYYQHTRTTLHSDNTIWASFYTVLESRYMNNNNNNEQEDAIISDGVITRLQEEDQVTEGHVQNQIRASLLLDSFEDLTYWVKLGAIHLSIGGLSAVVVALVQFLVRCTFTSHRDDMTMETESGGPTLNDLLLRLDLTRLVRSVSDLCVATKLQIDLLEPSNECLFGVPVSGLPCRTPPEILGLLLWILEVHGSSWLPEAVSRLLRSSDDTIFIENFAACRDQERVRTDLTLSASVLLTLHSCLTDIRQPELVCLVESTAREPPLLEDSLCGSTSRGKGDQNAIGVFRTI